MNEISIKLDKNDLCKIIKQNLKCPESDKVAEVITEHLSNNSIAFEQCFKAFMGIFPFIRFNVGDVVYINFTYLPTWRLRKEETLRLPDVKGELVPALITSADKYNGDNYNIEFMAIANNELDPRKHTWQINDRYVEYKSETIEDFLEDIEKSETQVDDTPF